jgi:hypothetical protein
VSFLNDVFDDQSCLHITSCVHCTFPQSRVSRQLTIKWTKFFQTSVQQWKMSRFVFSNFHKIIIKLFR